ncbi:type II pantothenate kinase [Neobacillus piezotolerans]|uniref:Type II pantothenate kinase n=1 Tax=Neobacillus piezotolerans TaxID=2259171 RepID=A0A3D8GWF7_9BACI|nr:type II pantothenate kinase [Neobacillus piezotolerans]RDU38783.1 type II pantothenate kinase [Neobacillus piezotolerans]
MEKGRIGIDAGGTLVKIAYEESGRIKYRKTGYKEAKELLAWLKLIAPGATPSVTGGRAKWVKEHFFPDAMLVPEFEAVCSGADILRREEENSAAGQFLLVNIGTGTSIFIAGEGKCDRVGGSGLGGGTLTGLGSLLSGTDEFSELVGMAAVGSRQTVDLLVKDIYGGGDEPLNGDMTAANFAKGKGAGKDDLAAAIINMIAETLVLLASQIALARKIESIIYAGSTLAGNAPLKAALSAYTEAVGLKPVFFGNGEYCGALGALMAGAATSN